jgi:polyhydroxyalkanoate synthase subunit PhaC
MRQFDTLPCANFAMADILRRAQGDAVAAYGLGPSEHPYRVIASGAHWRLRAYGDHEASPSLLVVAAPIKRPYIWDLAPSVSAIRHCLEQGLNVHLLEWMPASSDDVNRGFDDCAIAIGDCIMRMSDGGTDAKPFLTGHSLGGTLAAMFAALAPESVRGLVLLCAPLCFAPGTSRFRDALISLVPSTLSGADPVPGSLLSQMSALSSPDTFIWSRLMDAALSIADPHAMEIHARVERWALDEVALPGKLVHQMIEWLYRENRFCRGVLSVRDKRLGPSSVSVPMLAVVNTTDEVALPASVTPFVDAVGTTDAHIIEYLGEPGVALQHLAILIGREAQAQIWPQIVSWIRSRAARPHFL